jgi:XTP/dITP diphosphohydrolase
MTILLATGNPAKQAALRRLLAGLRVTPVTPDEIGLAAPAVAEDRPTHRENAEEKAIAYARAAEIPAIASDGGMEIPVLGGRWDGLCTRRFAGPTDDGRIRALLALLDGVPPWERTARLHEAVAAATPGGNLIASRAASGPWGRLAESADYRVEPGFWIPALWLYPPRWVTQWDLREEERAALETAWDAVARGMRPALRCYLDGRAC